MMIMMTYTILNILLLSLVFSFAAAFALFLRRRIFRGRETVMCVVWIAVLVFAVIPVYSEYISIKLPDFMRYSTVSDIQASNTGSVMNITDSANGYTGNYSEIELARRLYGILPSGDTADIQAAGDKVIMLSKYLNISAYALTAVWICGALILFIKSLIDYARTKKMLILNSAEYDRGRIYYICNECRGTLGIRREIHIRIVREGYTCSPCVVGLLQPEIYMGRECRCYSDSQLKFILMHELCHVKRHDLAFKMFTLIVSSLHWFNPMAYIVSRAINEDCELACDSAVLGRLGRLNSDSFMYTILDIADRLCRSRELGSGLFMSGNNGKRFLERRYINMKTYEKKRGTAAVAALFICIVFIINAVIMSSCGAFTLGGGAASSGTGNLLLDEALRGYYRLTDNDVITQEQIDGITTLEIRLSDLNAYTKASVYGSEAWIDTNLFSGVYVDYIVNGEEVNAFPENIDANRFKEVYLKTVNNYYNGKETLTENDMKSISNSNLTNPYITTNASQILSAFYTIKDPNDPNLSQRDIEELKIIYPFITDYAVAVFDPYASPRELNLLASYYCSAGLFNGYTILDGYFDASSLMVFNNLRTVIYSGVKPVNENLPVGATSQYVDYQYNNILSDRNSQTGSVTTTVAADPYSEKGTVSVNWNGNMYTVPLFNGSGEVSSLTKQADGTETITFLNKSLQAAIEEYFVMALGNNDAITAKHLEEIKTMKVRLIPENDIYYDGIFELHGGHYIEYTINGVTLGLLPAYYSTDTLGLGLPCDILLEDGLYTPVEEDGISYYKLNNVDLTTQSEYFTKLAQATAGSSLLLDVINDEDGGFITEFGSDSAWSTGICARYLDTPVFQTQDMKYFPNLELDVNFELS